MNKPKTSPVFQQQAGKDWEPAGTGIQRQILGYDESLMLVRVKFQQGAIAPQHAHPHVQATYVINGRFRVTIGSEVKDLQPGDGFFVPPDVQHGATCLEAGELIDTFSPAREDFLTG